MAPKANTREVQDDKKQGQEDDNNSKHFYPARCAGSVIIGVAARVGVRGRVRHAGLLLRCT